MRASSSTTVLAAARASSPSRGIAACSVRSDRCRVRRCRQKVAAAPVAEPLEADHEMAFSECAGLGARGRRGGWVSILTAAVMVIALKSGVSPLPKPLGLAFAETVLGRPLPVPVGLLFHTVWVTTFSVIYVGLFRDELTFLRALALGAALWILVLVFFFPVVGWGILWARGRREVDCRRGRAAFPVRSVSLVAMPLGL